MAGGAVARTGARHWRHIAVVALTLALTLALLGLFVAALAPRYR